MKALTTRQPWAWAIVMGFKPLENRSRPFNHRGPLLIHASLAEETHMVEDMLFLAARQTGTDVALLRNAYRQQAHKGAILGAVTVKGCVTWHASEWFFGPHALVLERPSRARRPVPCRGALGLWQVPADVMAALEIPGYVEAVR
jgi:hypothetical protein